MWFDDWLNYSVRMLIFCKYPKLCKYDFVYKLQCKDLYHKVQLLEKTELVTIKENLIKPIDNFIKLVKSIPEKHIVYFYIAPYSAWDSCIIFLYINSVIKYLEEKQCIVFVISEKNFRDIAKLQKRYCNFYILEQYSPSRAKLLHGLPQHIKDFMNANKWEFISVWPWGEDWVWWTHIYDYFIKTWWNDWSRYQYSQMIRDRFEAQIWKKYSMEFKKEFNFKYDSKKFKQLKDSFNWYRNKNGKIILCNFESNSMNLWATDWIVFKNYITKLKELNEKFWVKFIVNSVYRWEKDYFENEIFKVVKLSFEEIIYLADIGMIDIFISERNWLNDVFYVFYKWIKQIIYFPNLYIENINRDYYNKHFSISNTLCVDNIKYWKFPDSKYICYWYREKFWETIENYLKNFL